MDLLPEELLKKIFARVDGKTLPAIARCCRKFERIIGGDPLPPEQKIRLTELSLDGRVNGKLNRISVRVYPARKNESVELRPEELARRIFYLAFDRVKIERVNGNLTNAVLRILTSPNGIVWNTVFDMKNCRGFDANLLIPYFETCRYLKTVDLWKISSVSQTLGTIFNRIPGPITEFCCWSNYAIHESLRFDDRDLDLCGARNPFLERLLIPGAVVTAAGAVGFVTRWIMEGTKRLIVRFGPRGDDFKREVKRRLKRIRKIPIEGMTKIKTGDTHIEFKTKSGECLIIIN